MIHLRKTSIFDGVFATFRTLVKLNFLSGFVMTISPTFKRLTNTILIICCIQVFLVTISINAEPPVANVSPSVRRGSLSWVALLPTQRWGLILKSCKTNNISPERVRELPLPKYFPSPSQFNWFYDEHYLHHLSPENDDDK